jgi:hypothetical protein
VHMCKEEEERYAEQIVIKRELKAKVLVKY